MAIKSKNKKKKKKIESFIKIEANSLLNRGIN